jgi:peptide deformylase
VTVQPVRLFDDPILRRPAEPVVDFDAELRKLIDDLNETMHENNGAGLTAPRSVWARGSSRSIPTSRKASSGIWSTRCWSSPDEEEQDGSEGHLSIPGVHLDTKRRMNVVAKGFTPPCVHPARAACRRRTRTAAAGCTSGEARPRRRNS